MLLYAVLKIYAAASGVWLTSLILMFQFWLLNTRRAMNNEYT